MDAALMGQLLMPFTIAVVVLGIILFVLGVPENTVVWLMIVLYIGYIVLLIVFCIRDTVEKIKEKKRKAEEEKKAEEERRIKQEKHYNAERKILNSAREKNCFDDVQKLLKDLYNAQGYEGLRQAAAFSATTTRLIEEYNKPQFYKGVVKGSIADQVCDINNAIKAQNYQANVNAARQRESQAQSASFRAQISSFSAASALKRYLQSQGMDDVANLVDDL